MRALTGPHAVLVAGLVAVLAGVPAAAATNQATTEATHLATQPPPGPFGTPNYQAALTGGDVRIVGNSVLRCPRDDEDRHHAGTSSDCRQATHLAIDDPRDPPNNDGYHMKIADVDGDGATITSSSAMLAIPPRSVVTYAQLTWGGHTGVYTGRNRLYCTDPDTGDGSAARTRFDTTPSTQPVTLTVDGRRAVLDPAHYTTSLDPGSDTEMYTGWQDVTGHLADLPAGSQVRVTVADVWAVYGFGCTAGWTLTVVYSTFGSPTMRTIDVYTDHFRKAENGEDTIALRGLNVRPNQAAVNLGVTGLQGDRDYHDRLQVAGRAVANPCLFLAYHDFFSSCAAGALDPDAGDVMRNNMSVEGKVVSLSPAVATDGNTIELRLPPSQDAYLLHGLVLSEVIRPRLEVRMTADPPVALPGETVTFTTTVTNASTDTMLPDVRLEYPTPGFSGCDKPIGWLQPGQSVSWTCSTVAGARGLTVQARGSSRYGSTNVAVDVAEAGFRVAGMQLSQTISPAVVASGAPVTLSSTVTNSGDAPATDVRVGHPNLPDCDTPVIASLAAGESTSVSCTTPAPAASFRGAGTGAWRSGERRFTVGANETALSVIHPGVSVTQTVAPEQVHPGEDAEFTTTLHNTGDGELRDVHVALSLTPSCPGTDLETLARDETVTITCGWTAGETGGANDVTVTATDTAGLPFSASFRGAAVRVVSPTLAVSQTVEPAEVRAGEEVTVTYTVRHTGDAADGPVTDLTVHSEQLPSCAPDPVPSLDPGASVTLTCVVTPADTVETVPRVSGTDALGAEVTATGEPATITVVAPELTVARTATPQTVRVGGSTEVEFTVTNSGDETDGAITGVTLADAGLADCTIAPLGDLAPGESATASCTLEPQESLTSTPVATGTDRFGEPVTASAEPLLIQVIDPKLEISVVADPTEVEPGDEVRFTVVVRNVGDVLLRVEVTNDPARDCDLLIPPERDDERDDEGDEEGGLVPGAAQSQKCTMNAPDEEGPFLDTATYSALPSGVVDPGEPLTGVARGTVQVTDDPSNGPGGENPGGGGGSGGGSGDLGDGFRGGGDSFGSGSGGSGGSGSGPGSGGDLAYTGASLLGPLAAGLGLLLVGGLALLVSRAGRRRAQ